jgi:hypothetical protein
MLLYKNRYRAATSRIAQLKSPTRIRRTLTSKSFPTDGSEEPTILSAFFVLPDLILASMLI